MNEDNIKTLENNVNNSEDNKEEKIKVLIADDVEIIAKTIKNILIKDNRFEVLESANNGTEEYERIIELKPNLVITDNQMPGLNGIDVIEKIYNLDIQDKPTFIMITGDAFNLELRNKANEFNIFRIIKKPVDEVILKDTIEEFIIDITEKNKENQFDKSKNAMLEIKDIEKQESFWKRVLKFFGIIKNTN